MIPIETLLGSPPVPGRICIPTYQRPLGVEYLPRVLVALSSQPSHNLTHATDSTCSYVNDSIIKLFDEAFAGDAHFAIYLADDCIPSSDFTRCAQALHKLSAGHLAFGLWWPTPSAARAYPELILTRRGKGWPAKAWGCSRYNWPELRHVISSSPHTYDVTLANHLWITRQSILAPLCSRVLDIGETGRYNTSEDWRAHFSWITDSPPFDDYYKLFE